MAFLLCVDCEQERQIQLFYSQLPLTGLTRREMIQLSLAGLVAFLEGYPALVRRSTVSWDQDFSRAVPVLGYFQHGSLKLFREPSGLTDLSRKPRKASVAPLGLDL